MVLVEHQSILHRAMLAGRVRAERALAAAVLGQQDRQRRLTQAATVVGAQPRPLQAHQSLMQVVAVALV